MSLTLVLLSAVTDVFWKVPESGTVGIQTLKPSCSSLVTVSSIYYLFAIIASLQLYIFILGISMDYNQDSMDQISVASRSPHGHA
jgi:hypothetical protein